MTPDDGYPPNSEALAVPPRKAIPASHVVAVFIGNGLEFYDFLSYALFAVYIGKAWLNR
jgi:hypothetical protein